MQTILILIIVVLIVGVTLVPTSVFTSNKKQHIIRNAGFIQFQVGSTPKMCYDVDHSSIEIKGPISQPGYKIFAGYPQGEKNA